MFVIEIKKMNRKFFIICIWITLICTIIFGIIEPGYFSWDNIWKSFVISSMYCIFLSMSQGYLNGYLDKKMELDRRYKKKDLFTGYR